MLPSVTRLAAPSGVNVGSTSGIVDAGDRPQLDRDDVVEHPPAVREAGQVAAEEADRVRVARRRDGDVEPQHVGLGRAGEVLEPGDDARRDAGQQDRDQVGAVLRCSAARFGNTPG